MSKPGDSISVSLDDIALTLRAIVGRRTEFPDAATVAVTEGPANGASKEYRASLNRAAQSVSQLTTALQTQLGVVEANIATTGQQLVAADESASKDVSALEWMLGTVDAPPPPPPSPSAAPGPTPSFE